MVLKKPYAFLIKNFKKIHFLLLVVLIFLAFKTSNLLNFYNDFIGNLISSTDASNYITFYMYLSIILILGICFVIFLLMKQKDKPKTLYIIMIGLYLVVLVVFFITSGNLRTLETEVLDQKTIRLYRDIIRILFALQCISIIPIVIRTMGFDIKKFEFAKDLNELNIEVTDNEEFELLVGVDTDKIKRKGRRKLRELGYYYQENKIFILIIAFFLIVVIGVYLFLNIKIYNKTYLENEPFSSYNFLLNVENSYLTIKNYEQEDVSFNDTAYVIVKLNVVSNLEGEYTLNINDFILVVNNETFLPTKKYYEYFKDIGIGYKSQKIDSATTKTYLLVYTIDEDYVDKDMILRYELGYEDNGVSNRIINLNPVNLDKTSLVGSYNINEELNFSDSMLKSSKISISSYSIKTQFTYTYSSCITTNNCYDNNVIVESANKKVLNIVFTSSYDNLNILINNNILFNDYITLKYVSSGIEYESNYTNITPNSYSDGVFLSVEENTLLASKIWLEFNIRSKRYIYYLKND